MPLIDIATIYRRAENPRRPFSYFFTSQPYMLAHDFLKNTKKLPENHIIVRSKPKPGSPTMARVHPLIAIEFIRWLDYGKFYTEMMRFYNVEE